jgi:GntR family transcriptional regulator/MocR family aminotransferase
VARHLGRSRGITVDPDEVLVTRGTAQALDLVARTLLRPGDPVAMESPAYPDAVLAFRTARARPVGVPVDAEGLVVDRLPPRAALVYCTPSHQAPVGPVLSLPRRVALLEWARRTGAWIVEDDYDTEYRWARLTLDPLKSLDADGRVLYLGSVSKTLSPRLRVGWIVAPPPLLAAVVAVKQVTDPFAERPVQRALARFIDEGRLALHVRRTAAVYGARRAVVLRCVAAELPAFAVVPGEAGLHVTVSAPADPDRLDALTRASAAAGVAVRSVRQSAVVLDGYAHDGLVLGFGGIEEAAIPAAVAAVAREWSG